MLSPDRVAPSQIVSVSASVNLPLHHNVQKFSFGTSSPVADLRQKALSATDQGASGRVDPNERKARGSRHLHCPSLSIPWWRGQAVEHWSLADVLSLSCVQLVADG